MSDPAKTPAEIEDVLASIRRLVSDHDPELAGATQAVAERPLDADMADTHEVDGADSTSAERLVLTPSQRISEADDPWSPVAETDHDAAPEEVRETQLLDVVSHAVEESEAPEIAAEITNESEWRPGDRLMDYAALGSEDGASGDEPAPEPEEGGDADDTVEDAAFETPEDDIASAEDVADLALLDGMAPTVANYESETGDENWPSESAQAALLTLVARRDPVRAVTTVPPGAEAEAPEDASEQAGDVESDATGEPKAAAEPDAAEVEMSEEASEMPAPEDQMDAPENEIDATEPGGENEMSGSDAAQSDSFEDQSEDLVVADPETPDTDTSDMDVSEAEVAEAGNAAVAEMPESEPENAIRKAKDHPLQKAVAEASKTDAVVPDEEMPIAPVFSRQRQRAAQHEHADHAPAAESAPEMASAAADQTTADTSTATIFDADDSVLDEETLRDIIVDVVREELQGVLGQRITRNVRKMVRREIRLALAAEDLE